MKKKASKIVCVRLNENTINEINNICNELEIDFSDFVRGAINFSLKCRAKKQKSKGGSVSAQQWIDTFYDNYMKEKGGDY